MASCPHLAIGDTGALGRSDIMRRMRAGVRAITAALAFIVALVLLVGGILVHRQFMQEQRRQSCYARMLVVQQRQPWDDETFAKQLNHCATGFYSV
jgi:hypothetical protein